MYHLVDKMDCGRVEERELIEQYLLGRLSEADRDAFEAHAFECERCLGALETMRVVQSELRRQRAAILAEPSSAWWTRPWRLAAVAAMLLAAVGIDMRVRHARPVDSRATVGAVPPSIANAPVLRGDKPPSTTSPEAMMALAQIEPPRFVRFTVRGAEDERSRRFERAMQDYTKADYHRAVAGLRRVLAEDPGDVETNFFLGVSLLMIDDVDAAMERLRVTLAHGESPFQQLASLDLAKALLRKGDVDGAERELNRTAEFQGNHRVEARDLLRKLRSLRGSVP